ncbi:MAG: hypothetical protein WEA04_01380 [Candidatus Andersenbacteria bacterium]
MNDPVFSTVLAGVLIFVLGQFVQNFILKPIQDFRVVLTMISHKVKFWANVITNSGLPPDMVSQARADMRDLSSNLESRYIVIPFKKILVYVGAIPSVEDVRIAGKKLIFLYNSGGEGRSVVQNSEAINELKKKLKLEL